MAKTNYQSAGEKAVIVIFQILVFLSLLSPLWVFKDLLFPFITSKAFTFRVFVELALPFYLYLLVVRPSNRPNWKNPLVLATLAFLALNFVSTFLGVNQTRSLWGNFERMGGAYYLTHLVLLSFYILLLSQMGGRYIRNMLYAVLGVAAFITLNGLSGWLGGPIVVPDPSLPGRVSSTLGNPIFLGSFLILPMFLAAFFAFQAETLFGKILFWAASALFLVGIFLSVTRGALVGLIGGIVIAAIVYVALHHKQAVRRYGGLVIGIFILALAVLFVFHKDLPQGGIMGRVFNLDDSTSKSRLIQWRTALDGFKDAPVFGVGPENYYVIANKYYNPEIIKYDPSWFDKPHNYVLEVLITTGVAGFLAYMAMAAFVCLALYKGFKSGYLSLEQLCLLLAGFAAYFIQNLFVFDTIPASMMFYVFVGFSAYLWQEADWATSKKAEAKQIYNSRGFAATVLVLGLILAVYAAYVTDYLPAAAAKNVNYGYAYASVDPGRSIAFFDAAKDSPFNFDLQDTAQRFSDSVSGIAQNTGPSALNADALRQALDSATAFESRVAGQIKNDPMSWQKLAADYYIQAILEKTSLSPEIEVVAQKAVALAPRRLEPQLFLAQLYLGENKLQLGTEELEHISKTLPLTAYTAKADWLLAMAYHSGGQDGKGIALINSLLGSGFPPDSSNEVLWALDYLDGQKNYSAMLDLAQQSEKALPNDADVYLELAKAYAKTGQIQQAKDIAQKMIDSNPPNKIDVEAFLKGLK
jgi:O-antigen ligase/tetratricopeptide (TPR) repeat protein